MASAAACGGIDNTGSERASGSNVVSTLQTKGSGGAKARPAKGRTPTANAPGATTNATPAVTPQGIAGSNKSGQGDVIAVARESAAANLWIAPDHPWYEWDALPAAQIPWQHITHLGLGNLQPQASGAAYGVAAPPGWDSGLTGFRDKVITFADAGHAASKKVFMMLGAAQSNTGDYAGVWNSATAPANVDAFADNVVSTLKDMHVDGIELDWEENIDYAQLVALAKKIRARWSDGIIFIDTMPLDGSDVFAALAAAKDDIDAFMPMTFLPIPQWGGWILPIPLTPLYGYPGNGYSVDDNLKNWLAVGVPASKVIMGVGGFGSVWGDSNGDQTAPIAPYITVTGSGGADGETGSLYDDTVVTQSWVNGAVTNGSNGLIQEWDDVGKCSYWHAPATNNLVSTTVNSKAVQTSLVFYETPRSMTEKVNYAGAQGMRGMNFWTLKQVLDGSSSPILETVMP